MGSHCFLRDFPWNLHGSSAVASDVASKYLGSSDFHTFEVRGLEKLGMRGLSF